MGKKSPIKISICNELFQGWPIEKVFEYTAELGYDGVEIAPYTLADSVTEISPKRRKAIRQAAEEKGIEIVGLHWLLAKPEGLYINHPMSSSASKPRNTSRHSSTSVLISGGRFWCTVLPIRGQSRRGGTIRRRGICQGDLQGMS